MSDKKVGHTFLASLGKTRLRPGGIEATSWLMKQAQFSKDDYVLEVACNMGTTLIEIAQTYHCKMIGVDLDSQALEKAKSAIKTAKLENQVTVQQGNALKLPFEDNTFDMVINEAMLTMLAQSAKEKALREYYRVLKPGGKLLTHDIALKVEDLEQMDQLSRTINMRVAPLTKSLWQSLYQQIGFRNIASQTGEMSLMSPRGMVRDEGLIGTARIIRNGLKEDNREQFLAMFHYFKNQRNNLQYIVNCVEK
ncbi:methyltransferase domain-containing protein [Enterococcus sp. AZ072]|uniref:class I SAM-dependent methyltransferase n=1 Tax=unclassified Enterococcus TaxID=2608891 RepID=UPI003D2CA5F6